MRAVAPALHPGRDDPASTLRVSEECPPCRALLRPLRGKMPPLSSADRSDLARLERSRALARLLDTAITIPGTRFRIGLDPLLGLIPGVGDLAGVLLSASILVAAARLRVPVPVLIRMGFNIGLEALIGTVPILGDLFDAGWRANTRNVSLIETHLANPLASGRAGSRWLFLTAASIAVLLVLLVGAGAWLAIELLRLLGFG